MRGRVAMGLCLAALCVPASASATVYTVNTTQDLPFDSTCGPLPGGCTIRDAFTLADGDDTITLPAGIYNLDPQLSELDLAGAAVQGAGARSTIIDGGLATRVMVASNDGNNVAPVVSGVTIRRGRTLSGQIGGGIQVVFGALTLVNSQVINSTADGDGGGIGVSSGADLFLIGSTVAGNTSTTGRGGGIFSANEGAITVANSTISGNSAGGEGGGLNGGGGTTFTMLNATIAGNSTGQSTAGLLAADNVTLRNTIFAGNVGAECSIDGTITSNNSLSEDATCGLVGNGNITGVNPGLGALTNNGGPTDTRAIGPASSARDNGGAQCQAADQRGIARPVGACDIGAFEYVAPRLTVIKRVVNDEGGTQAPGDFSVHVRSGAADVAGSPQPGTESGRTYTLAPGTYSVAEAADDRYTATFSGGCSASGAVTLAEGQVKTCTITNADNPPVVGEIINAEPARGTVKIKLPGDRRFQELEEGEQLPVGTVVDTLAGRVTLFAAANKNGGTAKSDFYAGIFKIGQTKGSKPITVLTLVEKLTGCKTSGKATTAAKRKKKRRLWGNGSGRFRTKGKHSAATVVGTKWLVEDRCTSTLTRVVRGRVRVRDFEKKKTVTVRAGKKYVAKARP